MSAISVPTVRILTPTPFVSLPPSLSPSPLSPFPVSLSTSLPYVYIADPSKQTTSKKPSNPTNQPNPVPAGQTAGAMGTYKCCLIFKRRFRWKDAPPPDDVRTLFAEHSGGAATMGADGLRRYLESTGGDPDAADDAEGEADRLLDQIRQGGHQRGGPRIPRLVRGQLLGLDDFHRFLFSADLNPPVRRPQVHHDMSQPLSHYYIYTGHNSYLTGNQLSSDCSDVPIIKALQRGVRVIELDMWPNSAKDDISILHGRLLLLCCYLHNIGHAIWMLFPTSIRPPLA